VRSTWRLAIVWLLSVTLLTAQQQQQQPREPVPPPGFGPVAQPKDSGQRAPARPSKSKPRPGAAKPAQPQAIPPGQEPAPQVTPDAAQAQPGAATPQEPSASGLVLNLQNADLLQVIDILARRLRINYILDPRVKGGVTINTYGELREVDLRQLLETILRINGAAIVEVGNIHRIIPIDAASRLPIAPMVNATEFPTDERLVLNLIFLKYVTVSEISALLQPFLGEGATLITYDPANLLLVLDNTRNMSRTMELIGLLDSDTFASQRVRIYEVRHGRPFDIARELDQVFRQISMTKGSGAVQFLPLDRINSLVAFAPNPGAFEVVEQWLKRLDVPIQESSGTMNNYVYRVKYTRAEILSYAISALYGMGGYGMGGLGGMMGGFGGMMGGGFGAMGGGFPGMGMGMGMGMMGGLGGAGIGNMYGFGANRAARRGAEVAPTPAWMQGGVYSPTGGSGYGYSNYTGGLYTAQGTAAAAARGETPPGTPSGSGGQASSSPAPSATGLTGSYLGSEYDRGYAGPRVVPNPFDNSLLIQATPQEYEQIVRLLEQLDIPPRQVLIEAKIYDVTLTGTFAAGVRAALDRRSGTNRTLTGETTGSGFRLNAGLLVGQSRELLAVLTAQEDNRNTRLISAPNIIATNSIPASINVGQDVPVLTAQAVSPIQTGGTSLFTNAITNRNTGVTLQIMAMVNPSGIVTMIIDQEVSAPQAPAADSAIQSPSFSTRNVSTQVTVQDGDTIAIGGIILESETRSSSGIPYLHRLPGIGVLFGSKSISRDRSELVIFLTPRVIYDMNQVIDATDELKSKLRQIRRTFKE
jgi:general secretion pathway protein D